MPGRRFVLLCLCIIALPATAEMYTWTDEQGTTHFSDTAPAARESERVTPGASSVVPMAANLRQGKKVSAIRQQVKQSLQKDLPKKPARPNSETSATEKQCAKLELRISKVQQRLRAGYSNDRGNSLRRQRRTLTQKHSRECILG